MEAITERVRGFIEAQTGVPLCVPPVREVSRKEIQTELREMSRDLLERQTGWSMVLRPLEERILGFLSSRIMGLYTQRYSGGHESEILLHTDRIRGLAPEIGLQEEEALLWVLSHEMFHAAQLDPALPLRENLQGRVRRFLQEREGLRDLQAAFSWIEGSADWVMDRPGLLPLHKIQSARSELQARRQNISWASLLLRLLGNKQAQYAQGRLFVEAGMLAGGPGTLLLPVFDPEMLPRFGEDPDVWAKRIS